ncbi:MAG: hypothetical protein ACKPKO_65835 [Candidatus Fonsibacter sp.]
MSMSEALRPRSSPCSPSKTYWTPCNNNPYSNFQVRRLVGGGSLDNIRYAMGWIHNKLPAVKGVLEHVPHQNAQTGANVLKALGYGKGQKPSDPRLT